ncbi:UNVERIFIED_CONTAM: hypothetical protein Slati_3806500 [Sesamum latifolium]|uniref:Uncharacterized protein n=1 Tax=Sesamum latifolium TaxID=2727402 RepID=A0AAW2U537_9LAMI
MEDTPFIQFGRAKQSGPKISHGDALVIPVSLANYEVGRIFIDWKLRRHTLWTSIRSNAARGHPLEKSERFFVWVRGRGGPSSRYDPISSDVRNWGYPKNLHVEIFGGRRTLSAYNVILGRPTFNASKQ